MADLKIVGITRYSVIYQKSFAATRGLDADEARKVIWRPERLAHRAQLFNAIALPSLDQMAARYQQFHHLVLVASDFPQPFKSGLEEMAASRRWLRLVEVRAGEDFSAAKPALREIVADAPAFVFRLDDDDAMAPQAYLDAILSHAGCPDGTVLSPDEGYMIRPAWKGVSLRKERIPFVSAGLGVFTRGPDPLSIHDLGNQNKIARTGCPVIHPKGRLWLRSKTQTSDTTMRSWKKWRYLPISVPALERRLRDTFPGLGAEFVVDAVAHSGSGGGARTT